VRKMNIGEPAMGMLRIRFQVVAIVVALLPLLSLASCVLLSILLHWDEVTSTHCRVPNYLPSLSAAVGDKTPQRYIWRIGIALHCCVRFIIPFIYRVFYRDAIQHSSVLLHQMASIACFMNIVENISLLVMTYVSSKENYSIHEMGFIFFIATSMIYMLLTCFLFKKLGRTHSNANSQRSLAYKSNLFISYILVFLLAMYFFWRHNAYCESGVYSCFALCEYMVVIINIGFHTTAYYDFADTVVDIGPIAMAKYN